MAIAVVDGFTDSGVSVLLDVLRTANALRSHAFHVTLVSADGGAVRSASGIAQTATASLRGAARADVVVAPGVWLEEPSALDGLLARRDVRAVSEALGRAHRRGALVGAACVGVFFLAFSGVLAGRRATTTWWLSPELARRFPSVEVASREALLVDDRAITAGAVFAIADLALHLVTRFLGPAIAHRCASLLLLDRHPSQSAFMAVHQLATDDPLVRRAERWARDHLAEPLAVSALAKAAGTSPRTLARRLARAVGLTPVGFVQRLRVETAVHLLRTTSKSVREIGGAVGYADEGTLRRLLRREMRSSARELRARTR